MNVESKPVKENLLGITPVRRGRTQEPTSYMMIETKEIMCAGMGRFPLKARPLRNGTSDAVHIHTARLLAT